jgi:hypothetical protein
MAALHVFDLDDTLVRYGRRGPVVPRQTFHALRALRYAGHDCVVVSYNPGARLLVRLAGLTKYITRTIIEMADDTERADLVARACHEAGWMLGAEFSYYDDRADNVDNVRARFGTQARCHRVTTDTLWNACRARRCSTWPRRAGPPFSKLNQNAHHHPPMLTALPHDCRGLIIRHLKFEEFLEVRGCSRSLYKCYNSAHPIWKALRPSDDLLMVLFRAGRPITILISTVYPIALAEHEIRATFQKACKSGQLAVTQWLAARFESITTPSFINEALCEACGGGHFAVVRWLVEHFELTAMNTRAHNNYALRIACAGGHLAVAQWLADHFKLVAEDGRVSNNHALGIACENGHLATAQWLATRFALTVEDARDFNNHALRSACEYGHLATAQWLATRFGLTAADARTHYHWAFRRACRNGHLMVAQWFTDHFGLNADDARRGGSDNVIGHNYAFRSACEGGYIEIAQWLTDRFELTTADARTNNNYALRYACAGGHLAVAQWLVSRFNLTIEDARGGHRALTQCLARRVGPTIEDARTSDKNSLYVTRYDVQQWMADHFGLGPQCV